MIANNNSIEDALRLLCIHSMISHGLSIEVLGNLKREIFQCYGYAKFLSLENLGKVGFLTKYNKRMGV